jgi:hypothetical protein
MKKKVLAAAFIAIALCASCGIPNAQNTASSASAAESADFSGEWSEEAEGFTVIDIWKDDYGLWHGEISRSDMDDSASFWSFSGTASGSEITYTDMKLIRGSYDEEGEVTEEAVYEDGSGVISLNDGKLYWRDDKENAAEGLSFIHTGDY